MGRRRWSHRQPRPFSETGALVRATLPGGQRCRNRGEFFEGCDPFADAPKEVLAPFAHLGVELPTKEAVDEIAARAVAADCLSMPATMMPAPIGYICMVSDPDGNMIEFSWDQGVYATLRDKWGLLGTD